MLVYGGARAALKRFKLGKGHKRGHRKNMRDRLGRQHKKMT